MQKSIRKTKNPKDHRMDEQNVVYPYNAIVFSLREGRGF